jgi:hypothetical protein
MSAMTFEEWREYKIKVMGDMPVWFENHADCQRRYTEYRTAFDDNCSSANPLDYRLAIIAEDTSSAPVVHTAHERLIEIPGPAVQRGIMDLLAPLVALIASAFQETAPASVRRAALVGR